MRKLEKLIGNTPIRKRKFFI